MTCACVITLPLTLLLLPQLVVNVTEGEVLPFCKLVTVTEYTLDCCRLDIVVLVGTFEPSKERNPVCDDCDPLPRISDHWTLYPVAPSTSSQETVTVVHVISIILTFVGAAGSMAEN